MKHLSSTFKLFVIAVSLLLSMGFTEAAIADNMAGDIKVPFGIRNYDIGVAPNFTLQDIDGETFELNKTKGNWVFLHFWASWCGPCRKEMPTIQKLANAMKDEKFKIVMINTAEDEDTVFEFLAAIDVGLNTLMDVDGLVTEVWKPRGLPTTFLINPKGEVKYQAIGGREWGEPVYVDFIKQLLKK
jgi:thiol-disulfide isomerase/thioredoxin